MKNQQIENDGGDGNIYDESLFLLSKKLNGLILGGDALDKLHDLVSRLFSFYGFIG